MTRLAKWSTFSIVITLFIVLTVFFKLGMLYGENDRALILADAPPGEPAGWKYVDFSGLPAAVAIMSIAFICHHNSFMLYCSIHETNLDKWNRVTHSSVVIALVIMGIFGLGGYATFVNATEGDILNNYCLYDNLMTVSRIFFALTVLLTYPLECFVTREVIVNAFLGKYRGGEDERSAREVRKTGINIHLSPGSKKF